MFKVSFQFGERFVNFSMIDRDTRSYCTKCNWFREQMLNSHMQSVCGLVSG